MKPVIWLWLAGVGGMLQGCTSCNVLSNSNDATCNAMFAVMASPGMLIGGIKDGIESSARAVEPRKRFATLQQGVAHGDPAALRECVLTCVGGYSLYVDYVQPRELLYSSARQMIARDTTDKPSAEDEVPLILSYAEAISRAWPDNLSVTTRAQYAGRVWVLYTQAAKTSQQRLSAYTLEGVKKNIAMSRLAVISDAQQVAGTFERCPTWIPRDVEDTDKDVLARCSIVYDYFYKLAVDEHPPKELTERWRNMLGIKEAR